MSMGAHTTQCQVDAIERGLDELEWFGEVSAGALCGTLEDRYQQEEVRCTCVADASICTCCLLTVNNGEGCQCSLLDVSSQEWDYHPNGLVGGEPLTTTISTVGYSNTHFSWRPCDLCGTRLGGDRHDVAVIREEDRP